MDLEETRAFLAVLDHGSFKAAAERVRQPRATLRRRVEALEARAGVSLFERSRSGVCPTPAGNLFARQARVMLRETNTLLAALREIGDEPTGELRVGVPVGLPPHTPLGRRPPEPTLFVRKDWWVWEAAPRNSPRSRRLARLRLS